MENKVLIPFELAKDAWLLINDAKHPHYESKVVEQIKNGLGQLLAVHQVNQAQLSPSVPEPVKNEENIKEITSEDAA